MHKPVLLQEVLDLFAESSLHIFVDGTVGGGGHAAALLQQHPEITTYLAIDRDEEALALAKKVLLPEERRVKWAHADFCQIGEFSKALDLPPCDGILADLGVSSMHLDQGARGFSFQREGPLDMRMDRSQPLLASTIVNEWTEEKLGTLFREYGEEPRWRKAARIVVAKRPLATTKELADALSHLYPPHSSRRHPCTRIFQALRIAVNDELSLLKQFLYEAFSLLNPGGRLAVISFHSLEDSIVKKTFALWDADHYPMEQGADYPLPKAREGRRVQRKPIIATPQEITDNPRARSAKLRCIEKC